MPNIGTVLKEEIRRLSRRSLRPFYQPLKKDMAWLKHQLAQLKRENQKLLKDNARLISDLNGRLAAPPTVAEEEAKKTRISPRIIRSQRRRLGLSRRDFANLIGVSAGAVVTWEGGQSRPKEKARKALAAIRKLGRREAMQRLQILMPRNGHKRGRAKAKTSKRRIARKKS